MYGLTAHDVEFINQKIKFQKSYLEDNFFTTGNGEVKTLLDVSFSANHSNRYYSQLTNKINTMTDYSKHFDLEPVFMTITLDGFYRDFLKADFKRFDSFRSDKKATILKSIPDNDIYGYLRQKIVDKVSFTIKDLYNVINYQFKKFLASYAFIKMRKDGFKYMYIRTAEPHKNDGVPHFHIMLYIPKQYFERVEESFIRYFPAPQNAKEGFITDIHNPAGYILKYITKSFMDVKNQNDIDYIQAWYIKHRIMRAVTSHFTVPQWIYQKCYAIEKDWNYLTDFIYSANKMAEWSYKDDYFRFIDLDNSREIHYEQGVIKLIREEKVLKTFGEKKEKKIVLSSKSKLTWQKSKKQNPFIPVDIDGEKFVYYNGRYSKLIKQPYQMNLLELYDYFHNIDIDTVDDKHYIYTRNLMIEKGLLVGERLKLTALDDIQDGFEAESVF